MGYFTVAFQVMLFLAALFGGVSGVVGTLISALGSGWPTGPFIVLTASTIFFFSIFFGAKKGILIQFIQRERMKGVQTVSSLGKEGE